MILQTPIGSPPVATDLLGNLVWYGPSNLYYITRPYPRGVFLGIAPGPELQYETLREFDLTGMTLRETNVARLNDQLAALGKRPIGWIHHEVRRMPGGKILLLATVEQILTDVQGPGPVDVIGDMILVLDNQLQIEWTWDTFDHLDVSRRATLNETCKADSTCVPYFLAEDGNDWTHGNAVAYTPDGNLLYSTRHQDWLIKIDYGRGKGDGHVLWRLGKDGDFTYNSPDPYPWFSHQHDGFIQSDNKTLSVFDNGNVHRSVDPAANSRGQVLLLDEENRTASFVLNVDLGMFALALGSAERLAGGNYSFDLGWVFTDSSFAVSMEVDPTATSVYALKTPGLVYRSFRMRSIYQP